MDDFYKPKMLWAETMRVHKNTFDKYPRFGLDIGDSCLSDKTCFFATGSDICYITAILNSFIGKYLCYQSVSILDDGGFLMQKIFIEKISIPAANNETVNKIVKLVESRPPDFENEIDCIVKNIYDFSDNELQFIATL